MRIPRKLRALHVAGLFGLGVTACMPAHAAPVGPALHRPALMLKAPERAGVQAVARAGERLVAVGERGLIMLSDDQGKQWRQVRSPTAVGLVAVRFADARKGWAVGHGGVVLASSDGGASWNMQLDGLKVAQAILAAARDRGDTAAIEEAQRLVEEGADKPFFDLHVSDARQLMVVGAYNLAMRSRDGGASWEPVSHRLDNPQGMHLYAVRSRGNEVVIAGEQGLVLRSTDGGAHFAALKLPYAGSFFTVALPGKDEIVVAGLRGNVLRSRDGGASWTTLPLPLPLTSNIIASSIDQDGRTWLSNQAGMLFRITNQGMELIKRDIMPLNDLLFLDRQNVLGAGPGGAQRVALAAQGVSQ